MGVVCTLALAGAVAADDTASSTDRLPGPIRAAMAANEIEPDGISLWIQRSGADEPRLRFNAERPRNPASVMKLFTTYALLQALGPGYTWQTRVHADGPVVDGRLRGDLRLEGTGDPYLTAEHFWSLVGAIRRRGIETITGDLVLDGSRFAPVGRDPAAFDGRPHRAYNQPPHPLLVNFNVVEFEIGAPAQAERARVATHPPLAGFAVDNAIRLQPDSRCRGFRWRVDYSVAETPDGARPRLAGAYGRGCDIARLHRRALPVEAYVHGLFTSLWSQWGGHFDGGWRSAGDDGGAGEPLLRHESRPLGELVRLVNKYSNNVMTRQMALGLAAERGTPPVDEADGRAAVHDVLAGLGLAGDGLVLAEVTGLSRANRVSARALAELLDHARDSALMPEFVASLPIAGVDGTAAHRLAGGPAAGRVRIKTGLIDHVATAAGYVRNAGGEELIVVILINQRGVHRGRGARVQDAVLRWALGDTD